MPPSSLPSSSSSSSSLLYYYTWPALGSLAVLWEIKRRGWQHHPVVKHHMVRLLRTVRQGRLEWSLLRQQWALAAQQLWDRYVTVHHDRLPPAIHTTMASLRTVLILQQQEEEQEGNDDTTKPVLSIQEQRDRIQELQRWIQDVQDSVQSVSDWTTLRTTQLEESFQASQEAYDREEALLRERLSVEQQQIQQRLDRLRLDTEPWLVDATHQLERAQKAVNEWKVLLYRQSRTVGVTASVLDSTSTTDNTTSPLIPPVELCCPITWDLMDDPVLAVADGHTYERSAIENHLRQSRRPRSPKTNEIMTTQQLIPNVAIRAMCRDFQEQERERESNNRRRQGRESSNDADDVIVGETPVVVVAE